MAKNPDMLRFEGGVVTRHDVGWTGPWPPPERFVLLVGKLSGMVKVADPDDEEVRQAIREAETLAPTIAPTIAVGYYRRESASQLPDDFEDDHVCRGAQYVPEEVAS